MKLPDKKYRIIYIDPPWEYGDKLHHHGGSADSHYDTMSIENLCKLPIGDLADEDCIMFCWGTWAQLMELPKVFSAWGFEYKTCGFIWTKLYENGKKVLGQGNYTRGNTEYCLIARKGKFERKSARVSQLLETIEKGEWTPENIALKLREHSEKPDIFRKRIVQLCGDLDRVEVFARIRVDGWDVWGNDQKLQNTPLEEWL